MLTPQEIQDKKFEKAMFGGYDMAQIDQFLDEVLNDYTALYKENATLKAKMRVLVDKIEEYRAVDEEMRKALYTAQVSAKSIVDGAQKQADSMLETARRDNEVQMAAIRMEIDAEQKRLAAAKKTNADYVGKIKALMLRNIEVMDTILDKPQDELRRENEPPKTQPAPKRDFEIVLPEEVSEPAGTTPAGKIAANQAENQPHTTPDSAPLASPEKAGMETRFFEIELGNPAERAQETRRPVAAGKAKSHAKPEVDEEGDTAKIYGSAFSPKPKFDFSDIRFGKDYDEDEDK